MHPSAAEIRHLDHALSQILTTDNPAPKLSPHPFLPALLRHKLNRLIRGGPHGDLEPGTPAQLLQGADRLAAQGVIPIDAALRLHRLLQDLSQALNQSGAPAPGTSPWWEPLPQPGVLPRLYQRITDDLNWTATPHDEVTDLSEVPKFLPDWLLKAVHDEITTAHTHGDLAPQRAGVGADAVISVVRSDETLHLNGRDAHLLQTCPHLAALTQVLLDQSVEHIKAHGAAAPMTAVLARYPAPSGGYHFHMDNPGGARDNGRARTLIVYLNPPDHAVQGGRLEARATGEAPIHRVRTHGGAAVTFNARAIPHRVTPVEPGPPRWSLTFWFNDRMPQPLPPPQPPTPDLTDVFLGHPAMQSAEDCVLFHQLDDRRAKGTMVPMKPTGRPQTAGLVTTVYRGGAMLFPWVRHHLDLGFQHLWIIFDHAEEVDERRAMEQLATHFGNAVTVLTGAQTARQWRPQLLAQFTPHLPEDQYMGSSAAAVSARQALNADLALSLAAEKGLDWLLHLDADELFHLQGDARGGANLNRHFQAAHDGGIRLIRYANHELLLPLTAGRLRFKRNPRLVAALLGESGRDMINRSLNPEEARAWFTGYHNGKSAVAVAWAEAAAGVHGWRLKPEAQADPKAAIFVAGPAVLHLRHGNPQSFVQKYRIRAGQDAGSLLEPTHEETQALALIHATPPDQVEAELTRLYHRLHEFTPAQIELMEAADLLLEPDLSAFTPVFFPRD